MVEFESFKTPGHFSLTSSDSFIPLNSNSATVSSFIHDQLRVYSCIKHLSGSSCPEGVINEMPTNSNILKEAIKSASKCVVTNRLLECQVFFRLFQRFQIECTIWPIMRVMSIVHLVQLN